MTDELRRILVIVDDPDEAIKARAAFLGLGSHWEVCFVESAEDAIAYLGQVSFDVVFADWKAGPNMCVQFLHEVWARFPESVRFVVAPSLSKDLMVACALAGHQFIEKPLHVSGVRAALERVDLVDSLMQEERIRNTVAKLRVFPPRPKIYNAVVAEMNSPDSSAETVAQLVSRDMAISTKLIQVVNSAAFGMAQRISTPYEAVFMLGLETTASLVLGVEAFSRLDELKPASQLLERVWRHSQGVARSAKQIADWMSGDPEISHAAFLGGLLHDLGKVALAVNLDFDYSSIEEMARATQRGAAEVEAEMLGANHAEAGGYLLGLWGLPGAVIEAVAAHHIPARFLRPNFSALTAVHLANTLERVRDAMAFGQTPEVLLEYPAELELEENMPAIAEMLWEPELANTAHFVKRDPPPSGSEMPVDERSVLGSAMKNWWTRLQPVAA